MTLNDLRPLSAAAGLLPALLLAVAGWSCVPPRDAHAAGPPATLSPVGVVPAEPQRPGDPEAGYRVLTENGYVSCGVPLDAYRQSAPPTAPEQRLPGRTGAGAELPYMLNAVTARSGVELAVSNCLSCHAAYFNGELIVGLGNETMDWTADLVAAAENVGLYVEGEAAAQEWRRWADRIAAIAPYSTLDTVGVNPANNLTAALIMHHDRDTLAWSAQPLLAPPPEEPPPVSVPPWWRMRKKHAMFYTGEGRGDHARIMMTAAILCTDSVEEAREIDAQAPDIRAFIASLRPPDYPFPVARELAAQGRELFAVRCAGCHGRYPGQDEDDDAYVYPNLIVPLEVVGTDPLLATLSTGHSARFIDWYNGSFFGERARIAPAPGYYAPPLDGIWATAPYLHNGSVPTLRALLDSPSRPTFWQRTSLDSTDYDPRALGWRYRELTAGKDAEPDWERRRLIYDTTRAGYSNRGHRFGDVFTDGERDAVLEYLKTL